MRLIIFEDDATHNFEPLTLTRGSFDLRLGILSFWERTKILTKAHTVDFLARDYIASHVSRERKVKGNEPDAIDDEALFVNALLVLDADLQKKAKTMKAGTALFKKGRLAMAKFGEAPAKEAARLLMGAPGLQSVGSIESMAIERQECEGGLLISNYWEIVEKNAAQIASDFDLMPKKNSQAISAKTRFVGKKRNLFIAKSSRVDPYLYVDAETGPVYIGEDCQINAWCFIQGPSYIGAGTIIHPSSVIREGSNIGPVCRVGGEVEESVMQAHSNKPHAGFLGHAYVGEWANLGAMFTNSDLKNTYGSIKVTVRGRKLDSGTIKLGGMIGDHAKGSIGSLLYTGKKVGVCSQIHGVVQEDVPSFVLYAKTLGIPVWELGPDESIQVARRVMSRRKVEMTKADEDLLRKVFEVTKSEREAMKPQRGPFSFA